MQTPDRFGKPILTGTKHGNAVANFIENSNKVRNVARLSKSERRLLEMPDDVVYIYNISPIWRWSRNVQGIGQTVLRERTDKEVYTDPLILTRIVRNYDAGNNNRKNLISEGLEVAEDFIGNSTSYPGPDYNNLENYGVFYTLNSRIEDLPQAEQDKLILTAQNKHADMCQRQILWADQLHAAGKSHWITEMYRLCALFMGEERPWVAKRGKSIVKTEECQFCGFENKAGVAKCQNCHEIVDQELYDKLKAKK